MVKNKNKTKNKNKNKTKKHLLEDKDANVMVEGVEEDFNCGDEGEFEGTLFAYDSTEGDEDSHGSIEAVDEVSNGKQTPFPCLTRVVVDVVPEDPP